MDLYRDNILDHYKNPRNFGKIVKPDAVGEENNPLCGDRIGMQIKFKVSSLSGIPQTAGQSSKFKVIDKIQFYGEGCAISIASASMLTEKVRGKTVEEVKKLSTQDILSLLGIKLTPTRLKCALLPLEVLQRLV